MPKRFDAPRIAWESGGAVAYAAADAFTVEGVDRRSRYRPGQLVYLPGVDKWTTVIWSTYSTNTLVVVADPVCLPSMSAVGYNISQPALLNACSGGTALKSSEYSATYAATKAFDGDLTTSWETASGTVNGVAYIGYQFAAAQRVVGISMVQGSAVSAVTSAIVRYSSDGSSWTNYLTLNNLPATRIIRRFSAPSTAYAHWSLLANSAPAGGAWNVVELEMLVEA